MAQDKQAFKYKVLKDGVVIEKGWAYDIRRRGAEIAGRRDGAKLQQVGGKTTVADAEKWVNNRGH